MRSVEGISGVHGEEEVNALRRHLLNGVGHTAGNLGDFGLQLGVIGVLQAPIGHRLAG
jgi:hypothetical protein